MPKKKDRRLKKDVRKLCVECKNPFYVTWKNNKKKFCNTKCSDNHHNEIKRKWMIKGKSGLD
jgi:hypothetical protein